MSSEVLSTNSTPAWKSGSSKPQRCDGAGSPGKPHDGGSAGIVLRTHRGMTVAKSPTEQIRELALEVRAPRERDGFHEREIQRLRDDLVREQDERQKAREARA